MALWRLRTKSSRRSVFVKGHTMFQQHRHRRRFDVGLGLVVALASTFMACSFIREPRTADDFYELLATAPYLDPTHSEQATYLEVPGLLKVQHRLGCTLSPRPLDPDYAYIGLRIRETAVIPPSYNTGTVFLNGWRLAYQDDSDHHVRGLGGAIFNITQTQNGDQQELHWEAGGVLSDDDGTRPYEWCGIYTLVFWHRDMFDDQLIPPQIAAWPYHTDTPSDALFFAHTEGADPGNDTARRELPGVFVNTSGWPQHAILPRAFGFIWGTETDHHLLQAGFDLGTSVANGNTIGWTSTTLWKDN